jgi:hypothetical protein
MRLLHRFASRNDRVICLIDKGPNRINLACTVIASPTKEGVEIL